MSFAVNEVFIKCKYKFLIINTSTKKAFLPKVSFEGEKGDQFSQWCVENKVLFRQELLVITSSELAN